MKSNKGITLVALVVTIIILLILAGVTIASLGQQGLFGKTQQAINETKNAQANENTTLYEYENYVNNYLTQQ